MGLMNMTEILKIISGTVTRLRVEVDNDTAIDVNLAGDIATETTLALLEGKDFSSESTLAALLAKVIASPSTEAKQDALLTELQLKADLSETQPVSAASLPLPTGAATSAKQDLLLTELQLKASLPNTSLVHAALTIDSVSYTHIKVGGANLANRLEVVLSHQSGGGFIFLGPGQAFTASKTTAMLLSPGEKMATAIGDGIDLYARTASGTSTLIVWEKS